MKNEESFNSKRGLEYIQLKDPLTCEHYNREVGCLNYICTCYTLRKKENKKKCVWPLRKKGNIVVIF
jgi:hypothetical protein